jgi:DNA-binding NtrC family response regulator
MASEGTFRRDLLYRLNVIQFRIPPLKERPEDIPHLVGRFIREFRESLPRENVEGISDHALEALIRHPWPGNVRELRNTLEQATLMTAGPRIRWSDLPPSVRELVPETAGNSSSALSLPEEWLSEGIRAVRRRAVDRIERTYLAALLRETGGRVGETAERAGISTRALYGKMKRLGLDKSDFRD